MSGVREVSMINTGTITHSQFCLIIISVYMSMLFSCVLISVLHRCFVLEIEEKDAQETTQMTSLLEIQAT